MSRPALGDDEIERRLPVWTVLSELFLDTSFDDADYDRMATALRQLPYDSSEIERILRKEVSPAFSWNLFSIAGEWIRWDQDEVRKIMLASLKKRAGSGWLSTWRRIVAPNLVRRTGHLSPNA